VSAIRLCTNNKEGYMLIVRVLLCHGLSAVVSVSEVVKGVVLSIR